jgi:hypothetical protein
MLFALSRMIPTRTSLLLLAASLLAAPVAAQPLDGNHVPDCSAAVPSVATLWPPNHGLVEVSILGVTDPDDDTLDITVVGVTQDEPLGGGGDACPDAAAVEVDETVSLRAERNGSGDGRVYHVSFTADDGSGGTCAGEVTVCVPHDQGNGTTCVDGGALVDSTGGAILCDGEACYADECMPVDPPAACAGVALPASLTRRLERAAALLERAAYDADRAEQEIRWRLKAARLYRKTSVAALRSGARGRFAEPCGDALAEQLAGAGTCAACLLPPE